MMEGFTLSSSRCCAASHELLLLPEAPVRLLPCAGRAPSTRATPEGHLAAVLSAGRRS